MICTDKNEKEVCKMHTDQKDNEVVLKLIESITDIIKVWICQYYQSENRHQDLLNKK